MTSVHDLEDNTCKLNPKVEGRVIELTPEVQMTEYHSVNIYHSNSTENFISLFEGCKETEGREGV